MAGWPPDFDCVPLNTALPLAIRWGLLGHFLGFGKGRGRGRCVAMVYQFAPVTLSGVRPWPDPYFKGPRLENRVWWGREAQGCLLLRVPWGPVPPDVNDLLKFIRPLHEGTLVFVASYDDPATK